MNTRAKFSFYHRIMSCISKSSLTMFERMDPIYKDEPKERVSSRESSWVEDR